MKQFIYGLLLIILFGCVQDSVNFSKTELLLFKNIGFDKEILSELKKSTTNEFFQFEISEPGYVMDKNGVQNKTGIKKLNGVSFKTSENQAYKIILENRGELQSKGYQ
ncbi:hypothetical protein [Cellulophaga omnivescoria]|uniref:hypothetical protein n=1 Tax=Cellulophaga omnivescoria TaxID=1888890 RepID=UPI001FEBA8B7|nr:hypothetical protein [Cellulophaga omnivescoria]